MGWREAELGCLPQRGCGGAAAGAFVGPLPEADFWHFTWSQDQAHFPPAGWSQHSKMGDACGARRTRPDTDRGRLLNGGTPLSRQALLGCKRSSDDVPPHAHITHTHTAAPRRGAAGTQQDCWGCLQHAACVGQDHNRRGGFPLPVMRLTTQPTNPMAGDPGQLVWALCKATAGRFAVSGGPGSPLPRVARSQAEISLGWRLLIFSFFWIF